MQKALITLALLVVVIGLVLVFKSKDQPEPARTERTTREVALACDPEMPQGFHIHPILEIVANGENVAVPINIGVQETCMTVLHTHTPDGVLHVESPEKRDFTLADFFAVWEQPFSKNEILTYKADASHRIRVTVDGKEVDSFENTVLKDGERIIISYEPI
jgi:hypothetical protein